MDWKNVKKRLLRDEELKKEYEKVDLSHSIGKMIIDARIAKHMTQQKLAWLVGTQQPSIARVEGGNYLPSLSFLQKIASALDTRLLPPRLEFLEREYAPAFSATTSIHFDDDPQWELGFESFNAKWQENGSPINDRTFSAQREVIHAS